MIVAVGLLFVLLGLMAERLRFPVWVGGALFFAGCSIAAAGGFGLE